MYQEDDSATEAIFAHPETGAHFQLIVDDEALAYMYNEGWKLVKEIRQVIRWHKSADAPDKPPLTIFQEVASEGGA